MCPLCGSPYGHDEKCELIFIRKLRSYLETVLEAETKYQEEMKRQGIVIVVSEVVSLPALARAVLSKESEAAK